MTWRNLTPEQQAELRDIENQRAARILELLQSPAVEGFPELTDAAEQGRNRWIEKNKNRILFEGKE